MSMFSSPSTGKLVFVQRVFTDAQGALLTSLRQALGWPVEDLLPPGSSETFCDIALATSLPGG